MNDIGTNRANNKRLPVIDFISNTREKIKTSFGLEFTEDPQYGLTKIGMCFLEAFRLLWIGIK